MRYATPLLVACGFAASLSLECGASPQTDAPPDCNRSGSPSAPATRRSGGIAEPRIVSSAPVLQPVAQVPLPGSAVRFDYQSADTGRNRLYISHMDAGELVMVDLQTEQVIDTVGGLPTLTGVLAVPELGKVYGSVTGNQRVAILDTAGRLLTQVGPIGFPDGIAYAPDQQKIYVSDESGGGEMVIDGPSNRVVTTVAIGGHAGNTVYDAGSHCILVAVQTQDQFLAIDPRSDRVIGRYSPPGMARPHGLLVDAARRILFVANARSATLTMIDLGTMRVMTTQPIGADPDVLAFDPGWRRLYVGSEAGVLSVFTEVDSGLVHEGDLILPHAHTVFVDPRSHLVYLPLESVGGQPMLSIMRGAPPAP